MKVNLDTFSKVRKFYNLSDLLDKLFTFIKNAAKMVSDKLIVHYDQHLTREVESRDWLPVGEATVGITAGATCPNNLIEDTIRRLFELRGISVQELLAG